MCFKQKSVEIWFLNLNVNEKKNVYITHIKYTRSIRNFPLIDEAMLDIQGNFYRQKSFTLD